MNCRKNILCGTISLLLLASNCVYGVQALTTSVIDEKKTSVSRHPFSATTSDVDVVPVLPQEFLPVEGELKALMEDTLDALKKSLTTDVSDWNSAEFSPSVSFFKMILGDKFNPSVTPDGFRANIKAFFGEPELSLKRGQFMGEQIIELDDAGEQLLVDLLEREQTEYLKGNVVLYHGLSGECLFLYQYYARLFSLLSGENLGELLLRGDHLYAINPKTKKPFESVLEVRASYGNTDYGKGANFALLHCNVALPVDPVKSKSSASAVGFCFNSFNAQLPDIKELVISSLVFRGMRREDAENSAKEFLSLAEKYYHFRETKNGGILAVSVPANLSKKLTLGVEICGKPYDKCPSVIQMIRNVQDASTQATYFPSLSQEEQMRIKELTNEVVVYLDPSVKFDIYGAFHYPLGEEQQQQLNEEFEDMVSRHVAKVLTSKLRPFPNSFFPLSAKISSEEGTEKDLKEAVPFLIERGFSDLADYVEQYKISIDKNDGNKSAIFKAFWGRHIETLQNLNAILEKQGKPGWLTWLAPKEKQLLWLASDPDTLRLLDGDGMTEGIFVDKMPCLMWSTERIIPLVEQKPMEWQESLKQKIFEQLFTSELYLVPNTLKFLMELGFPLNPDTPEGKENFDEISEKLFGIFSSEGFNFPQAIGEVLAHYKLPYKGHEKLYTMLVNVSDGFWPSFDGRLSVSPLSFSDAYKIENFEGEQRVPLADMLNHIDLEKGINSFLLRQPCAQEKIARYLSQKTGREYKTDLVVKFSTMGNPLHQISEGYLWLQDLEKISNLDDARKMVHELDDLGILFCNLHLIDKFSGGVEQTDKWFSEIIDEYNRISTESTTEIAQLPLSKIVGNMHKVNGEEDVFSVLERVWRYNPNFSNCLYKLQALDQEKVADFIFRVFEGYPALKSNKELVDIVLRNLKSVNTLDAAFVFEKFKTKRLYEQFDIMQSAFDGKNSTLQTLISGYLTGKCILDTEVTFREWAQVTLRGPESQFQEFWEYYGLAK